MLLTRRINLGIYTRVFYSKLIFGAIAQLGERLTGSQEVVGSIPIGSTRKDAGYRKVTRVFSFRRLPLGCRFHGATR